MSTTWIASSTYIGDDNAVDDEEIYGRRAAEGLMSAVCSFSDRIYSIGHLAS